MTSTDKILALEQIKKDYLRDGILKDMECSVEEKPTTIFLGSTDKKGYIIKISMHCLGEHAETYADIEPWFDRDEVVAIIKLSKEESMNKFADFLLPKLIDNEIKLT